MALGLSPKALRIFLVLSMAICLPAGLYFVYVAVEVHNFMAEVREAESNIPAVSKRYTALTEEVTKEYARLDAAFNRLENLRNPDFKDFIEGHREDLAEIDGFLKNAKENLDEARALFPGMLKDLDYDRLIQIETAIGIAKKKIEEARESLNSYRRAI